MSTNQTPVKVTDKRVANVVAAVQADVAAAPKWETVARDIVAAHKRNPLPSVRAYIVTAVGVAVTAGTLDKAQAEHAIKNGAKRVSEVAKRHEIAGLPRAASGRKPKPVDGGKDADNGGSSSAPAPVKPETFTPEELAAAVALMLGAGGKNATELRARLAEAGVTVTVRKAGEK